MRPPFPNLAVPSRGCALRLSDRKGTVRHPHRACMLGLALTCGLLVAAFPVAAASSSIEPTAPILEETIPVPVDGRAVQSTTVLYANATYLLRASGTAVVGGPGYADAEYAFDQNNQQLQDNCFDSPAGVDLGIGVDDTDLNSTRKSPFWGPFNPTHMYTVAFTGRNGPITLDYHDCNESDNSGSLTVVILRPPQRSWTGLLPPISANGSAIFKRGRTVPVAFRLVGNDTGDITLAARLTIAPLTDGLPGAFVPARASLRNIEDSFAYDPTVGLYVFYLDTSRLVAGHYRLQIDLGDGVPHTTDITLSDCVQQPSAPTSGCAPTLPTDPVPQPNDASVPYYSATGHTLSGPFRAFWHAHRGLTIFGVPISEVFSDDGRVVQFFERAELVLTGSGVGVGPLGSLLTGGRTFAPVSPFTSGSTARYFPSTRHGLRGVFLAFWLSHQGALLFGPPVSEPLREQNGDGSGRVYLVQYFRNARLEYHPELAGSAYAVSLGLLGRQYAQERGWL